MSTVFLMANNKQTGLNALYSITGSTLDKLNEFLSPNMDIVTNIWQKRYVFLDNKYYDSMTTDVEKTDPRTVANRTVATSEVKAKHKKTGDIKYRFTANSITQFKKDESISLLLKIDEYADQFQMLQTAEEIQLKPTARKIMELIDKTQQIFTEDSLVHSTSGGNIIAWRVGSFNGHTVITLENTPDAQKYVLANEDAIVGLVHRVPAEFDANAVTVNARFIVGDEPKDCLQTGNEDIHAPLVAGATAQVVRQWKNYFELSLSDNSHVIVELTMGSDEGCRVEYGVYGERKFQYIELTKVTPIEGQPSSIGSRWRVSSMDFTGIKPEINVFTPEVQESISDLDAFKFVSELNMVSLADTTLEVTKDVNLRPSFSLEPGPYGQGPSYGKLLLGTSNITVDSVVYDDNGRAWFHVKNNEGLPLSNKHASLADKVIRQGWLNGKLTVSGEEQTFRFEGLPIEQKGGYNIREKACDYVTVTQNLGLIEEDLANKKAWTMEAFTLMGANNTEVSIDKGKEVRLVQKDVNKVKFNLNGTVLYAPVEYLGTKIRIDATPEHASAFVPKANELKIGDAYMCVRSNATLKAFCAFVVDDLSEETVDAVQSSVLEGDAVYTIIGEHTHGSVRYLQLTVGDDEEGMTFWADEADVIIPTFYELAEGDKAKSFAPDGVIFLESPLSDREAAVSRKEAGSDISDLMGSAKGVNVSSKWGISLTAEDKKVFTKSKLCALENYPTASIASVHVLGQTKSAYPVTFYRDGESIKAFVGSEPSVKTIDGFDGDFHVSNSVIKDIINSTLFLMGSLMYTYNEDGSVQSSCDVIWADGEPFNDVSRGSFVLVYDFASGEYVLVDTASSDIYQRDDSSDLTGKKFITHGAFEMMTDFNGGKVAITANNPDCIDGCRVLKCISRSSTSDSFLYVYGLPNTDGSDLRMMSRKWADVKSDESLGTCVVMRRFSEITQSDAFVTVSAHDGVTRKVASEISVYKCYVNAANSVCNHIEILSWVDGENKTVAAGTVPSITKKIDTKDAQGNSVSYFISDDGYAYPASALEEVQDNSFSDQYAESPKHLWITRDPEGNSKNNPTSESSESIVIPTYASPNDDAPNGEITLDAHGEVVELLGDNEVALNQDGSWIHIRKNQVSIYVHNPLVGARNLYYREVTRVSTKAVFVGNDNSPERQSLEQYGTDARKQCETDAIDTSKIVLKQGDIVDFLWKFERIESSGANKSAMLFLKDGTIHSVNAGRINENFVEVDATKDMFYVNSGIPSALEYNLGDNGSLSSVPSSTVPKAVSDNKNFFIAPNIPADAYMSARISLGKELVSDADGNVDVSGFSYSFRQPVVATHKVTVGNSEVYYAFAVDVMEGETKLGTARVWAMSTQLARVQSYTEEDVDLYMFPKKLKSTDIVNLLDAANDSANPTAIDGVPELHAVKACKDNGVVKYYRLAGDQNGKYINASNVIIPESVEGIKLFHTSGKLLDSPLLGTEIDAELSHPLFMVPSRKISYEENGYDRVVYEVSASILGQNPPSTSLLWIAGSSVTLVPEWDDAVAVSGERISIDAGTDATLWPDDIDNAPVMHTFAQATEMDLHSVVKNANDSTKYYCISMKREELNKADSHVTCDDPRTQIDERQETVILFIPVAKAHQVQSSNLIDIADFDMFVGDVDGGDVASKSGKMWSDMDATFRSKWSKADGSDTALTDADGAALLAYLSGHQWVAPIDASYESNGSVVAYRLAYRGAEDNGLNLLACLKVSRTVTQDWVDERKVSALSDQDAVVVEADNDTVGEILTVLWKFTTDKDGSEFKDCGIAVPLETPTAAGEIVKIVEL